METKASTEDERLLARVARRDRAAFEALYTRLSRAVYSLAVAMLRDAEAAREIAQDVFLAVWQGATRFDPERGNARSWILSLAHHKTVDALRRRRLREAQPLDESLQNPHDVIEDAIRGLRGERVRQALRDLSAEQREAIVLAYYGGYTQQEIAGRLDVPLGTVKTRIRDGMIRLRRALGHVGEEGL